MKALDTSLALAPRNAEALALKGFLLAAQNDASLALVWFDRALDVDSSLGNAWLGRGLCRIRLRDFSGGRDPQSHDAYFSARSKDRKLLIQFDTESSHPFLTRVVYSY